MKLFLSVDKVKQVQDTPYFGRIILGFVLRAVIVQCRSVSENFMNTVRVNKWLRTAILNKEEAARDAII